MVVFKKIELKCNQCNIRIVFHRNTNLKRKIWIILEIHSFLISDFQFHNFKSLEYLNSFFKKIQIESITHSPIKTLVWKQNCFFICKIKKDISIKNVTITFSTNAQVYLDPVKVLGKFASSCVFFSNKLEDYANQEISQNCLPITSFSSK